MTEAPAGPAAASVYLVTGPGVVLVPLNVNTPGNVGALLLYRDQQVQGLVVKTLRSNGSFRIFGVMLKLPWGESTSTDLTVRKSLRAGLTFAAVVVPDVLDGLPDDVLVVDLGL